MTQLLGSLIIQEHDDVKTSVVSGAVVIRVGDLLIHFLPEHLALLERLETVTATARRDLEAIIASVERAA